MKVLLQKTEPIDLRGTVDKLRIRGTVVIALAVDDKGGVNCVQIISGHPLIIGTTIASVRRWTFRPYAVRGLRKDFHGRIAISYQASELGLRYRVIEVNKFNLSLTNRSKIDCPGLIQGGSHWVHLLQF
jgi:hypothetical protein